MKDDLKQTKNMEDDLTENEIGRGPQFLFEKLELRPQTKEKSTSNKKWKMTSFFCLKN
jgi:hypothetical protein